MQTSIEQWRPIAMFDGWYDVSDLGRVRRVAPGPHATPGRILNQRLSPGGYPRILVRWCGKNVSPNVHQLVAVAFLGPREPGRQVHHVDGCKTNNRADNLEWTTPRGNILHAFRTGLNHGHRGYGGMKGSAHPRAKLTDEQIAEIRALRGLVSNVALAPRYGVSHSTIARVQTAATWSHLSGPPGVCG